MGLWAGQWKAVELKVVFFPRYFSIRYLTLRLKGDWFRLFTCFDIPTTKKVKERCDEYSAVYFCTSSCIVAPYYVPRLRLSGQSLNQLDFEEYG